MLANQAISESAYSYGEKKQCDEAAREWRSHGRESPLLSEKETLEGKAGSPGERTLALRL